MKKFGKRIMENWKLLIGSTVFFIGLIAAVLIVRLFDSNPLVGLSLLGIVTLFIALIGGNILSKERDLTTGEVRRAIAISSTVVFFGLFFLGSQQQELKPIVDNFWIVYSIIIGFYFGTRAAEEILQRRK